MLKQSFPFSMVGWENITTSAELNLHEQAMHCLRLWMIWGSFTRLSTTRLLAEPHWGQLMESPRLACIARWL